MFPKPERPEPPSRTGLSRHYATASAYGCVICGQPHVQLHHVRGVISAKTGLALRRRDGQALAAVVPLCADHHAEIERINEPVFEIRHGKPAGWLLGVAAGLLASTVLRG